MVWQKGTIFIYDFHSFTLYLSFPNLLLLYNCREKVVQALGVCCGDSKLAYQLMTADAKHSSSLPDDNSEGNKLINNLHYLKLTSIQCKAVNYDSWN